ncbi:hypothetical protein SAMN00790413_03027 [Deinococcus hopiensis KR-140]|uniref:Uncharacterized protein n=1 Tax=Deinococcus hopiensis KR-140 TaxID=695939 RepID=A0A1W1VR57_9DEIO|nr:hypothetical protein SAMN00790413_03027 [Deinococcus hopiensis KR-140]
MIPQGGVNREAGDGGGHRGQEHLPEWGAARGRAPLTASSSMRIQHSGPLAGLGQKEAFFLTNALGSRLGHMKRWRDAPLKWRRHLPVCCPDRGDLRHGASLGASPQGRRPRKDPDAGTAPTRQLQNGSRAKRELDQAQRFLSFQALIFIWTEEAVKSIRGK